MSTCPLSDNTEEDTREQRGTEGDRGSTGALCLVPWLSQHWHHSCDWGAPQYTDSGSVDRMQLPSSPAKLKMWAERGCHCWFQVLHFGVSVISAREWEINVQLQNLSSHVHTHTYTCASIAILTSIATGFVSCGWIKLLYVHIGVENARNFMCHGL